MNATARGCFLAVLVACEAATLGFGFQTSDAPRWPDGIVTVHLKLGNAPTYSDGTTPNSTAAQAVVTWNPYMGRVQLRSTVSTEGSGSANNSRNEVFFGISVYDLQFGPGVLAVALTDSEGGVREEVDIIVNQGEKWDSYRGPHSGSVNAPFDLRRVVVHEVGHLLGLSHDGTTGSIMNATVGVPEIPNEDDRDSIAYLYGRNAANPPVAPTVEGPHDVDIVEGDQARFFATATGSRPLRYQWRKNGVNIPGAIYYFYEIARTVQADAGDYSAVVSNDGGSVTTRDARLTITPATAPRITRQPASLDVPYLGQIYLFVEAAGSTPLTYQWRRDGENVGRPSSSSDLSIPSPLPKDAGVYTVVVTNAAGSVESQAALVRLLPPVVARITSPPQSHSIAAGFSTYLDPRFDLTGAGAVRYQWYKDGVALSGAIQSTLYFPLVASEHTGSYHVEVTGIAGTAVSEPAILTVLPPVPPRLDIIGGPGNGMLGGFEFMRVNATGSRPLHYQWAKDGYPIAGATEEYLRVSDITEADLGNYTVTVTNDAGVATSNPVRLHVPANDFTGDPWLDVQQRENIVYFVAKGTARMARYDLAAETWLPNVSLGVSIPTAFVVAAEGVYVAYSQRLALRSPDLATEMTLAETRAPISRLFIAGDYVYHNGASVGYELEIGTIHRSTRLPGPSSSGWIPAAAVIADIPFAPVSELAFVRAVPGSVLPFRVGADGFLTRETAAVSYQNGQLPYSSRTFLFPNERFIADDAGTILRTPDLVFAGSFGDPVTDMAFLEDGRALLLRRQSLFLADPETFLELGRTKLERRGYRVFARGSVAFVFGDSANAGSPYTVTRVSAGALIPQVSRFSANPPTGRYSVEEAFIAPDNVVYGFSRTLQGFVRWSADTREFLPTITLREPPIVMSRQIDANRVLLWYGDGALTDLPLGASTSAERTIAQLGLRPGFIAALDDATMVNINSSIRLFYDPAGHPELSYGFNWEGDHTAWDPATRALYWMPSSEDRPISRAVISETGFASDERSAFSRPPFRLDPETKLLITGSGDVLDASLQKVGSVANRITDAAWHPEKIFTIRASSENTEVQRWSRATYELEATTTLAGRPIRIFKLRDDRVLIVTTTGSGPRFSILNLDLAASTTTSSEIAVSEAPGSNSASFGESIALSVAATSRAGTLTYQWTHNGAPIEQAAAASYTIDQLTPEAAGVYSVVMADQASVSEPLGAIVGIETSAKTMGDATEIRGDIVHPKGNIFDQVLLAGKAASITADRGQVTRMSYVDLTDDIVQVEFSGAGTLTLTLDSPSGPAMAANYNQPDIAYMKGHARIVIVGADETTNVGIFSVGRATAVNASLFRQGVSYDGMADLASLAISSPTGKFGQARLGNVHFFETQGLVGLYAPGVWFQGPVYVGDIDAYNTATPVFEIGGADRETRVTGGDLAQTNHQPVRVNGLTKLEFTAGSDSHGGSLPAQTTPSTFVQNGVDVTRDLVDEVHRP